MGPVAPKPSTGGSKRLSARAKVRARLSATGPLPPKTFRPEAVINDGFLNTKRDKRQIKHSVFVSRISKAVAPASSKKRRRPSKKLVATLESLGDALDDIADEIEEAKQGEMDAEQAALGKVRHKSLKSRPGALKRKEKVVKGEMERFGRSLAQLAMMAPAEEGTNQGGEAGAAGRVTETSQGMETDRQASEAPKTQGSTGSNQWAALRQFISSTMEQNPAFLNKT